MVASLMLSSTFFPLGLPYSRMRASQLLSFSTPMPVKVEPMIRESRPPYLFSVGGSNSNHKERHASSRDPFSSTLRRISAALSLVRQTSTCRSCLPNFRSFSGMLSSSLGSASFAYSSSFSPRNSSAAPQKERKLSFHSLHSVAFSQNLPGWSSTRVSTSRKPAAPPFLRAVVRSRRSWRAALAASILRRKVSNSSLSALTSVFAFSLVAALAPSTPMSRCSQFTRFPSTALSATSSSAVRGLAMSTSGTAVTMWDSKGL